MAYDPYDALGVERPAATAAPVASAKVGYDPYTALGVDKPEVGGLKAAAKQVVGSTIKGAGQLGADFIPGVGADNALVRKGQEIIDANPTAIQGLGDIADKPGTFVKEAVGNALPSVGGMLGLRALGAGITAAAPLAGPAAPIVAGAGQLVSWAGPTVMAALPSYGGIRETQEDDSVGSKLLALGGAAAVGRIEQMAGGEALAGKLISKAGRDQLTKATGKMALTKTIGKEAGKAAIGEATEEGLQNPIEQLAGYQNPLTSENLQETALGMTMGAVGGGVLGGAMGSFVHTAAKDAPPPDPTVEEVQKQALAKATGGEIEINNGLATITRGENTLTAPIEALTQHFVAGKTLDDFDTAAATAPKLEELRTALQNDDNPLSFNDIVALRDDPDALKQVGVNRKDIDALIEAEIERGVLPDAAWIKQERLARQTNQAALERLQGLDARVQAAQANDQLNQTMNEQVTDYWTRLMQVPGQPSTAPAGTSPAVGPPPSPTDTSPAGAVVPSAPVTAALSRLTELEQKAQGLPEGQTFTPTAESAVPAPTKAINYYDTVFEEAAKKKYALHEQAVPDGEIVGFAPTSIASKGALAHVDPEQLQVTVFPARMDSAAKKLSKATGVPVADVLPILYDEVVKHEKVHLQQHLEFRSTPGRSNPNSPSEVEAYAKGSVSAALERLKAFKQGASTTSQSDTLFSQGGQDGQVQGRRQTQVSEGATQPLNAPALTTTIDAAFGKGTVRRLIRQGKVQIVASAAEVPGVGPLSADQQRKAQGVYRSKEGKIYLVANNLSRGNVLGVFKHEVVHALLRQDATFMARREALLKDFAKLMGKDASVDAAVSKVPSTTQAQVKTEEALAYWVQNEANHKHSLFKRMVAVVKAALKRLGIPITSMTTADFSLLFARGTQEFVGNAPQARTVGDTVKALYSQVAEMFGPKWRSRLAEAVQSKGSTQSASNWLKTLETWEKKGTIPAPVQEELEWSGLKEYLQGLGDQKISRTDIVNYLSENGVQVQEVVKGAGTLTVEEANRLADLSARLRDEDFTEEEGDEYDDLSLKKSDQTTKFSSYQLPGGQNYKELLLTLPQKGKASMERRLAAINEEMQGDISSERYTQLHRERAGIADRFRADFMESAYRSSHFDEPNILAHVRFNERVDAEGSKVLFIEEVQSDWHQEGRKKGYKENLTPEKIARLEQQHHDLTMAALPMPAESKEYAQNYAERLRIQNILDGSNETPDAPFKNSWSLLAMKRMIRYAAENGFDKIAWTTGEQQAERYDLSKQVDKIYYSPYEDGTFEVTATLKNGAEIPGTAGKMDQQKIADTFGKEVADKIAAGVATGKESGTSYLSGLDLKVGGEGMKAFYDKMLPSSVGKFIKQFGGKVEEVDFAPKKTDNYYVREVDGLYQVVARHSDYVLDAFPNKEQADARADKWNTSVSGIHEKAKGSHIFTQPGFTLTPSMRESALGEGMPLFSQQNKNESFDPSEQEAAKIQKAVEGKSLLEVADYLATASPNESYKLIARKVKTTLQRLKSAGATMEFSVAHIGDSVPTALINARGLSSSNMRDGVSIKVWVNGADVTGKVGVSYETLLHELIHAATQATVYVGTRRVAQGKAFSNASLDLIKVSNQIIDHFNTRAKEAQNGGQPLSDFEQRIFEGRTNALQNEQEVLAWAFTNKDMQEYLEGIKIAPKQSLWSKFVSAVRTALGLSATADTTLSEVLRTGEEILNAPIDQVTSLLETLNGKGSTSTQVDAFTVSNERVDTLFSQASTAHAAARARTTSALKEIANDKITEFSPFFLRVAPLWHLVQTIGTKIGQVGRVSKAFDTLNYINTSITEDALGNTKDTTKVNKKATGNLDAFNKAATLSSFYQMVPWKNLDEQDWIGPNAGSTRDAKLKDAEMAWKGAGMDKATGKTFIAAWTEAHEAYQALKTNEAKESYKKMARHMLHIRDREKAGALAAIEKGTIGNPVLREAMMVRFNATFQNLKGVYWPLTRWGDYTLEFKGLDGTVERMQFPTRGGRTTFIKDLLADGVDEKSIKTGYMSKTPKGQVAIPSELMNQFSQSIIAQRTFGLDPEVDVEEFKAAAAEAQSTIDDLNQIWLRWQPETAALKNSIRRRNFKGYDLDASRGYLDYAQKHAHRIAWMEQGRVIENELMSLNEEIRDERNKGENTDLKAMVLQDLRERVQAARDVHVGPVASFLGRFGTAYYMTSPSIALVQMTQLPLLTLPKLGVMYKNGTKAAAVLTKNIYEAFAWETNPETGKKQMKYGRTKMFSDPKVNDLFDAARLVYTSENRDPSIDQGKALGSKVYSKEDIAQGFDALSVEQKKLFILRESLARNWLDISATHEAEALIQNKNPDALWRKTFDYAMMPMRISEQASRKAAILATLEMAQGANKGYADTMSDIHEVVQGTLFSYDKTNKPVFLQGSTGRVLAMFQWYRIMSAFRMGLLFKRSIAAESKDIRTAAQKEFVGILGMTGLLAGTLGMPMASLIFTALDAALGDDDEPVDSELEWRNMLKEQFGERLGDIAAYGLPAALGMHLTKRIGMGDTFGMQSSPPPQMAGKDLAAWWAANQLGPAFSIGQSWVQGYDEIVNKGNVMRGLEVALPKPLKDAMKAIRVGTEGEMTTISGKRVLGPDKITADMVPLLAPGFNPLEAAKVNENTYSRTKLGAQISRRRGRLIEDAAQALQGEGDVFEAKQALMDFNRKNPAFAIQGGEIRVAAVRGMKEGLGVPSRRERLLNSAYGID